MTNKLTPQSSLEGLRKEAKRWLKALQTGETQAQERFSRNHPDHKNPSLRTVQHALAVEYGFSSWAALKRELEERALALRSHSERLTLFLEKSANRYHVAPGTAQWNTYERDTPARSELAARLLARYPEIARDSIHTAVAAHDAEAVREFLLKDPALADQPGGPDGWTPLLRLAYTRLPIEALAHNAIEIATALLDQGANPKASWSDGANGFTVLTGVIGGGEGGQSAHPQAEALARLLIARGADPFDFQALYNTSLEADSTMWLDLLWSESNKRGEASKWTNVTDKISAVDYLLGNAVAGRHTRRVAWLLEHGANANVASVYSKQAVIRHAVLAGAQDIIDLLVRHGALRPVLSTEEEFLSAAMQGDVATLRRFAADHPEYLRSPHAMFAAIHQSRTDVAELLLEMGMSPNVSDHRGQTPLHLAALSGCIEIAKLLIARGADIDAMERNYNSTPLGGANYHGRTEMVAMLVPLSRDIRGLCFAGAVDRLAELLAGDASLASKVTRGNEVPLFALPDDDERAVEVAELLLAHGADPSVNNAAGLTPAQAAKKRGLEDAAAVIEAKE